MLDEVLEGKDVIIKDDDRINVLMKCNLDREVCVSFVPPCLLTSRLESRVEILV